MSKIFKFTNKFRKKFIFIFGDILNLNACSLRSFANNGNAILKLRKATALGAKGFTIELPKDDVIFEFVKKFGVWSIETSQFLSNSINYLKGNVSDKIESTVLVDLGANSGLVTLQTHNLIRKPINYIVIEPIPIHMAALKSNLSAFIEDNRVDYCAFALGDKNGKQTIFVENGNKGNSSILKSAMPEVKVSTLEIDMMNSLDFFQKYLYSFNNLFLKSDIQGFDAKVLASIPLDLWKRVHAAVIEVWALPEIRDNDVFSISERLQQFNFGWSAETIGKIKSDEVENFWLGKSGKQKDLYLLRKPGFFSRFHE